jgi:hypothetical protein
VLSGRRGVSFDPRESAILKANTYAVWLTTWIGLQFGLPRPYFGVTHALFRLPPTLYWAALAVSGLCLLGFLGVIARRRWRDKPLPPASALAGYVAGLYAWMLFSYQNQLVYFFIPLFHSLQYLLFVWKYQDGKAHSRTSTPASYYAYSAVFIAAGIALGFALFWWIPRRLDLVVLYDVGIFGPTLFMFALNIFINIHHYFIDTAIWRKDNPEMRYLFA